MLSDKEKAILLLLFKDFSISYNARSISGKVGMTPRGALKALKSLEKQGFAVARRFGRAIEYKFNFSSALAKKSIELFLLEEAELKHRRWLADFGDLADAHILVLFGSVVRKEKDYNDIDLVVIVKEDKFKTVYKAIGEKQGLMTKRIHVVWQSPDDLRKNLKKKDPVMLDALRTGVVLKGQNELVGVVENVTGS
jgi:predicted nucleotidyltransferase/DNA-binding MarR family transcriptional regulator